MTRLDFDTVTRINAQRCERWHPGFPNDELWNGADWANAMQGEAGEAGNVVKKLRRRECEFSDRRHLEDAPELKAKLEEEVADTFLYLDLLCTKYGIDLPAAIVAKFNLVSEEQDFPERLELGAGEAPYQPRLAATEALAEMNGDASQLVSEAEQILTITESVQAVADRMEDRYLLINDDDTPDEEGSPLESLLAFARTAAWEASQIANVVRRTWVRGGAA